MTRMEEMQEALKGKNRVLHLETTDCMPSDAECSFSNDSLDDRATKDESSQRDSSTVISELSSTKTLMNIGDETRLLYDDDKAASKEYLLTRRHSDSMETEENATGIQYSWQNTVYKEQIPMASTSQGLPEKERIKWDVKSKRYVSCTLPLENKRSTRAKSMVSNMIKYGFAIEETHAASSCKELKDISTPILKIQNVATDIEEHKQNATEISSIAKQPLNKKDSIVRQKNIDKPFATVESLNSENTFKEASKDCANCPTSNKISKTASTESRKKMAILDFDDMPFPKCDKETQKDFQSSAERASPNVLETVFYLSPIEENSETSSVNDQKELDTKIYKTEKFAIKPTYNYRRKYHTYPKSRIPVAKHFRERRFENYAADSRMFPLEPREIDLESFQQLHTADSQEELQEFLLLESQCSGDLGLAANILSTSEIDFTYDEHYIEDERGTMSGRISLKTNN